MTEKELKQIFAKNLRELMSENDMRQQDLIQALSRQYGIKVNQGTVSSWVTASKLPRPIVMERIGNLFGWDIAYMLSDSTRNIEKLPSMPKLDSSMSISALSTGALASDALSNKVHVADKKHRKVVEQVLKVPIQKLKALELFIQALDPDSVG